MPNMFRYSLGVASAALVMGSFAAPQAFAATVSSTTSTLAQEHPAMNQVLQYGSQNHWVATLQADLALLGYSSVGVDDGIFGANTLHAVDAFQSANGFPVTGVTSAPVWQDILAELNIVPQYVPSDTSAAQMATIDHQIAQHPAMSQWLQMGSTGHWVMTLQADLRLLGYTSVGPVDGIFGPLTQGAVEQFQSDHGLTVNGISTPATWQAILTGLQVLVNSSASSTSPTGSGSTTGGSMSNPGSQKTIDGYPVIAVYHVKATAYGPSLQDNYPYGPVDAFGQPLEPGMVAVDPSLIPLKSRVYVTGYTDPNLPPGGFLGRAMDTGGAIKGYRIDVYMDANAQTVSNFGIEPVTVYVLGNN